MAIRSLGDDRYYSTRRPAIVWRQLRLFAAPPRRTLDRMAKKQTPRKATTLTPFDGRNVVGSTIAVTGAGDGLSKAMEVEAKEYHHGQTVYVVIQCTVANVKMVPENKDHLDGDLIRQHSFAAGLATIVDGAVVSQALEDQRKAIEEAQGIQSLGFDAGDIWQGDGDAPVPNPATGSPAKPAKARRGNIAAV